MKQQEIEEELRLILDDFDDELTLFNPNDKDYERIRDNHIKTLIRLLSSSTSEAVRKERERVRERIEQVFDPFRSSNQKIKGKRRFGIANFKVGARDLHDKVLSALSKERTDNC